MAYLAKDDYTLSISLVNLDEITAQAADTSGLSQASVLANAESWARAFVKSYLVNKYNIAAEFGLSSPDPSRNILVMGYVIDLALCQLHKTINPRDIPELRYQACEAAVQWLKDARDGTVIVDLPLQPVTPGAGYPNTFAESQVKFISKPYSDLSIGLANGLSSGDLPNVIP